MPSISFFIVILSLVVNRALSFQPIPIVQSINRHQQHNMAVKNVEIRTEDAPEPLGPYTQAVLVTGTGSTLYCSGNIAIDRKTGEIVGGTADVQAQTRQVLKNMDAVLKEAGATPSNVVRCTVFLDNLGNFVSTILPNIPVYGTLMR